MALLIVLVFLLLPCVVYSQVCSAVGTIGMHTCNVSGVASPTFTGLTPPPYVLNVTGVDSGTPALGTLNANVAAVTLTPTVYVEYQYSIFCTQPQGTMTIAASDFSTLTMYEAITIENCRLGTIPANAFTLTSTVLTRFEINGGTIDAFTTDFLSLLQFNDSASAGHFQISNIDLSNVSIPLAEFGKIVNLRYLTLKNLNLQAFYGGHLSDCSKLSYLDLTGNQLTVLSNGVFDNVPLSTVIAFNNPWECSCDQNTNIWLMDWAFANRINLQASLTCHSPDAYAGTRMYHLNHTTCAKAIPPDPWDVVVGFFLVIAAICVAAALWISQKIVNLLREKAEDPDAEVKVDRWKEEDRKPFVQQILGFIGIGGMQDDAKPAARQMTGDSLEQRQGKKKKTEEPPPMDMFNLYNLPRPASAGKAEKHDLIGAGDGEEKKDSGKTSPADVQT